jgi:hypothetical protein
LSKLKAFYTNGKLSKCRFQKWACILHLKLQVSCYKLVVMIKRKIITQIASFDSQPLKLEKQGSFSLWGNCFMRNFVRAITYFTSHWGSCSPRIWLRLPLNPFFKKGSCIQEKINLKKLARCYFSSSILSMKKRKNWKKISNFKLLGWKGDSDHCTIYFKV